MNLISLYPPIMLATVVVGLWFALVYRLNKRDTPGNESWALILSGLVAPVLMFSFFLTGFGLEPGSRLYTFFSALVGVGFGFGILAGLGIAFARSTHPRLKIYLLGCSTIIFGGFTAFLFL